MRTIEIDGSTFNSLAGFYNEIEKHLSQGNCPWGRNLDSLDEIVLYNFNYTENRNLDVTKVVWRNFEKSKSEILDLRGSTYVIDILVDIFQRNKTILFERK